MRDYEAYEFGVEISHGEHEESLEGNTHDRDRAVQAFSAELKLNQRDYEANVNLARLYREDGKLDEAAKLLHVVLENHPEDAETLYQLAQVTQAKGSTVEAVTLLEKVIKQDPEYIAPHVLLARLYYKLNRTTDGDRERAEIERLNNQEQRLYLERQKRVDAGPQTPQGEKPKKP